MHLTNVTVHACFRFEHWRLISDCFLKSIKPLTVMILPQCSNVYGTYQGHCLSLPISLSLLSLTLSFRHLIEITALWCTQVCCIHYIVLYRTLTQQCHYGTLNTAACLLLSQTFSDSELTDRAHVCLSAFVSCIMKLIKTGSRVPFFENCFLALWILLLSLPVGSLTLVGLIISTCAECSQKCEGKVMSKVSVPAIFVITLEIYQLY